MRLRLINRFSQALIGAAMTLSAADLPKPGHRQSSDIKAWLKIDTGVSHLKFNVDGRYLAFIPDGQSGIRIINTKNGNIIEPSGSFIGPSFFWSPDGNRLFYRELMPGEKKTTSRIRAWDVILNKNIEMESFDGPSGLLTFDARDHRMLLMHEKGIKSKRLVFPDNRLAFWQKSQRRELGKWVMAQKGVTFVTDGGFVIKKLEDDQTGIESFDISPDGSTAAWATKSGKIYTSTNGEDPKFLDWGRDPQWHPERNILVYAGGRMVGTKASDFDIKITSPETRGSFLTASQDRAERWPTWHPDGQNIIYTVDGETTIHVLSFNPKAPDARLSTKNSGSESVR
jgi:Tol biopolymer transport system component